MKAEMKDGVVRLGRRPRRTKSRREDEIMAVSLDRYDLVCRKVPQFAEGAGPERLLDRKPALFGFGARGQWISITEGAAAEADGPLDKSLSKRARLQERYRGRPS
jgi:hypothetical protein